MMTAPCSLSPIWRSRFRFHRARHGHTGAFAQGFAAGALLVMITDTMLPEAYDVERVSTGALVAIGFAISLTLSAL